MVYDNDGSSKPLAHDEWGRPSSLFRKIAGWNHRGRNILRMEATLSEAHGPVSVQTGETYLSGRDTEDVRLLWNLHHRDVF